MAKPAPMRRKRRHKRNDPRTRMERDMLCLSRPPTLHLMRLCDKFRPGADGGPQARDYYIRAILSAFSSDNELESVKFGVFRHQLGMRMKEDGRHLDPRLFRKAWLRLWRAADLLANPPQLAVHPGAISHLFPIEDKAA